MAATSVSWHLPLCDVTLTVPPHVQVNCQQNVDLRVVSDIYSYRFMLILYRSILPIFWLILNVKSCIVLLIQALKVRVWVDVLTVSRISFPVVDRYSIMFHLLFQPDRAPYDSGGGKIGIEYIFFFDIYF